MHGIHDELLMLLVLVSGSLVVPLLAGQLRLPSSVLLIAYGLAVGPHGLGWLRDMATVGFLYEVGFIMLMFLAGMEIDFNNIRQRGRKALLVVLIMCGATFALAFLGASWAGLGPIYGLAFGATSVGLPLAVLKETHNLRTPVGQSVMLVGSMGEFLTVIGMTVYYFGARHGLSLALLVGLGKLLGMLALSALVLRTMVALAWWRPGRFSRLVDEEDASEIGVRTAMVLMMVFSLLAVASGLEPIVGSFVAGALISFVLRGKDVLEEKLSVVGHGLFIPLFFAVVGMRFDPRVVTLPNLALAGKFMAGMLGVRLLPGVGLLWLGSTPRQTLAVSAILSAPLTLLVAIAALGLELGAVDQAGEGTLVLLAALSGVVFPLLFRLLDRSGATPDVDPGTTDEDPRAPGCPSYSE